MEINHTSARKVWGELQGLRGRVARAKDKMEKSAGEVKAFVVTNLASLGVGYANAKMGQNGLPYQVLGMDADMLVGLGVGGVAISGLLGKHSEEALLLGIAASNSWSNREGAKLAQKGAAQGGGQATGYAMGAGQYTGAAAASQYTGAAAASQYAGHGR